MQPFRQVLPADGIAFDIAVIAATSLVCYGFHLLCEGPFMHRADARPRLIGVYQVGMGGDPNSRRSVIDDRISASG